MAPHHSQPNRRQFLGYLSLVAAATTTGVSVPPLRAESVADWDMSWVDEATEGALGRRSEGERISLELDKRASPCP
jgi:hypothetical protein